MSVKKVSSEVAFITEPRTDFTRAAKSWKKNITLGSWPASSIVLARKWVEPDSATVEVELPTDVAFSILPQRSDSSVRERARYVSLPTPVGHRRVFLIDQVDLQELSADRVKASIKALSPEAWLSQVPSTVAGADQAFSGSTAEAFKAMLYESTVDGYEGQHPCTEKIEGVQYRALPILGPGSAALLDASQLAYYGVEDVNFDPEHSPSDGKPSASIGDLKPPFPAPVGEQIFSLMKRFPYQISMESGVEGVDYRSEFEACLVPVESPFKDGCLWWRWLFHKKQAEPIWISRQAGTADGEATLHLKTGKTDVIAWIASTVEGSAGKAATASFPGKPRYAGPWASVEAKEVSEGQHLGKADAAREAAAALAGLQAVVTIDATTNAGSEAIDAIKLRPGSLAGVRFGKQGFTFPIQEVDYSFTAEKGWEIKAPVSVETNSIDYRYPWWQSEGGGESPVPPEERKAGLKKVYGSGWSGCLAKDLRGEWWVLSGADQNFSEPRAKKVPGLPSGAELISIARASWADREPNSFALFQAAEKTLAVSTGITDDALSPAVHELSLDAAPVSAVEAGAGSFWLVTDTGALYSVRQPEATGGEPTVEKSSTVAGLFHASTFLPGTEDGSLLVASSSFAELLVPDDDHDRPNASMKQLVALEPGEAVLAAPLDKIVVTSQRVLGLENTKAAAVQAHGGPTGGWPDREGCFLGCRDGSLLFVDGNKSWNPVELAVAPAEGAAWRGTMSSSAVSHRLAWGSRGLLKLERARGGWKSTTLEASPVLTVAGTPSQALGGEQVCFTTEAGELKTVGNAVSTVSGLSFKPKRCWASLPLASQEGNEDRLLKGQILVAGEGSEAALLTQSALGGPWKEEKLATSAPVKAVVKPLYGSFFIQLEDGSLVDEQGRDVLAGSVAEGAKVSSIAEDSTTGGCWLATDRGAFRAAATHDSIFVKPPASQPAVGQVEKLEGSWGEIKLVSSGVMAGPEEAHFGHPASAVKLAELSTPAVAAEPSGDSGCFLLLEDGSVCLQPSASSAFWRVAEPPEGWKPTKLKALGSTQALAWAEDGHSELVDIVFSDFSAGKLVKSSKVTALPQLAGGLAKLKAHGSDTFALSGGKLFALGERGWAEDGRAQGEGSLTDFAPGWPFFFQRGEDWLREWDHRLQKISGVSGELLSRESDFLSTAGGAVDFSHCQRRWSAEDGGWVDEPMLPAVVSAEAGRFLGSDARQGFLKQAGGHFSLRRTDREPPADHSAPYWPATWTLKLEDAEASYSSASKHGSLFWLGSKGITDGDAVLKLTSEQREAVDWAALAACAHISEGPLTSHGLLVPLKSGQLAWLKRGEPLARFSAGSAAGLLGLFGGEGYWPRDARPLLAASSSAVSAAWPGTGIQESPSLLTSEPRGLRGEEVTAVVWGRYGASMWYQGRFRALWPALEARGAVKEARVLDAGNGTSLAVACEQGLVSSAFDYGEVDLSWPGEGLSFEPSGYRPPDTGQIGVLHTASGELWLFFKRKLVKTGVSGAVADQESTGERPLTVAGSTGLTRLTLDAAGKLTVKPVAGSKPATAARKAGASGPVVAYEKDSGELQLADDSSLHEAGEAVELGLTAIRGSTEGPYTGPLIYGAKGVVAVKQGDGGVPLAASWSEKLAKLGLPTEDEAGSSEPDFS